MSFRLDPSALSRPSTRRAMAQFPYRRPSVASDAPDNPPAAFTPPPSRDNFSTYSQTSRSSSRMVSVPETPVIYRSMVPIRPLEDWRDMTGIAAQTAAGDVQEVGGKSMAAGTSFPSLPSSSSLSPSTTSFAARVCCSSVMPGSRSVPTPKHSRSSASVVASFRSHSIVPSRTVPKLTSTTIGSLRNTSPLAADTLRQSSSTIICARVSIMQ
ncbi:hypothetical protein B0H13DRAFT_2457037 [Mycena leptocephala]|nr:hypothetical protein B0H13DRAFT_2457037 [Mycena leptocephala]